MAQTTDFPHLADAAKQLRQAQYLITRAIALLVTHPEEGQKALSEALANLHAAEARITGEMR